MTDTTYPDPQGVGKSGTQLVLALMDRGGMIDPGTMADHGVNPETVGPAGWGPTQAPPLQQYVSGQTQNRPHNYSAEPRRRMSTFGHYPRSLNTNPHRNSGFLNRYGQNVAALIDWPIELYRPVKAPFFKEGMRFSQRDSRRRQRQRVAPIVEDPTTVPWTETVAPITYQQTAPRIW